MVGLEVGTIKKDVTQYLLYLKYHGKYTSASHNFKQKMTVQVISIIIIIPLIQVVQQVAFGVDETLHLHTNSLFSTYIQNTHV